MALLLILEEMVAAIGLAPEADILQEVQQSRCFSIIFNEATDTSVTKSLGLCMQYLDADAKVKVRALALIELPQGTADAVTRCVY